MLLRKSSRVLRVTMLCGVALMVGVGWNWGTGVVRAQKNQNPPFSDPATSSKSESGGLSSDDPGAAPMLARTNEERANALNEARHKRLEDDADRLLALSAELKTDVNKADKDELSLEVMRKAAQIEKLAHDVQNRMKN